MIRAVQYLLVLWLSGCTVPAGVEHRSDPVAPTPTARTVEAIADAYLAAFLQRYPALVTQLAIPGARHDTLFDNSPQALARWQAQEDGWLADLSRIGVPEPVGSRDWITYGILHEQLSASKAQRVCRKSLWETSTTTAWYTDLPLVFDIQPVADAQQQGQALLRLSAVAPYIDTEIDNLRRGLALGYSSPRVTVAAVPAQVRTLLQPDSPFLALTQRAASADFTARVTRLFNDQIAPAVERFARFIEQDYLPQARTALAISHNPNGARCYPALVRAFATIPPAPEAIHALGLAQIAGIRNEMREILSAHYGGEAIETFVRRINTDAEFTFRSETAVLEYSQTALAAVKQAMPAAFEYLPKADVVIKPYPAFKASGVGEYQSSSEDGSRPGVFFIAVRDPQTRTRATQQSTLYHETYPGHHLQGAIALELGERVHPLARYLSNSGFVEGWALYAERLAQELELYRGPLDLMGLLSDQAARAARLVIDTGLHTQGWSRQQAVDYMLNNTGWSQLDIENDVDRYISWPGQANAYMLGMLEIRRLRTMAEQQLGADFDLRAFHRRVLEHGGVTLPMLEQSVWAWLGLLHE